MRLVKRSVNQDDVSAYHLFYADAVGSPGTDLTFFDWNVPGETRGTGSITRTGLRVSGSDALDWWVAHLKERGVVLTNGGIVERDSRQTLSFEDGEGQRLFLIDDSGRGDAPVLWEQSPVPGPFQIRGLGPVVMSVPELKPTDLVLTRVLHMRAVRDYTDTNAADGAKPHTVVVYAMGAAEAASGPPSCGACAAAGPHAELHVAVQPELPPAQPGAGGVHHVAFRTPNDAQYEGWIARLNTLGVRHSGAVDRYYFRSLYFREPNGILFEIATDGPGFGVDENLETLGQTVALPPFLEPRRAAILADLKPLD